MSTPDSTPAQREVIDPLALTLFGVRDHVRHHHGCSDRRGIGGHHYDLADECALRDIIERYGDQRAEQAADLAPSTESEAGCDCGSFDGGHPGDCAIFRTRREAGDVGKVALREQMIEAVSARLHITTDRITGLTHGVALSADTAAVDEAVEALMPLIAERENDLRVAIWAEILEEHVCGCVAESANVDDWHAVCRGAEFAARLALGDAQVPSNHPYYASRPGPTR